MNIIKPKDASSLIIYKTIKEKIYLLMGRRPAKQKFMPNIFVFPGGAVEKEDYKVSFYSDFTPMNLRALAYKPSLIRARAIGLASIRETYEETGIFVGKTINNSVKPQPSTWRDFEINKIKPRLDILNYIARAVTPVEQSKRFNARFFICDSKYTHGSITQNNELLEIDWYPISEIVEKLPLAQVTHLIIKQCELYFQRPTKKGKGSIQIPIYSRRKGRRVTRYASY